jgi:hypothetical protein
MPANKEDRPNVADVGALIGLVDPAVGRVLNQALEGKDVSAEEALILFDTTGLEYSAMTMAASKTADKLRIIFFIVQISFLKNDEWLPK